MQGVRLGRDELISTYGISQRLAVRVGALLARGVEVTPAILEMGGPGSAIEKFLRHPEMIEKAGALDTALAKRLAAETGADQEGGFVVAEAPKGTRVLALEEELLAEEGWDEETPAEPMTLAKAAVPGALLQGREAEKLFTTDEMARLKLEALAGRDAASRISALRKLLYAPLSPQVKGGIYLRALLDTDNAVRSEAIRSLESLGFHRDTADAIQAAFTGGARKAKAALRRIGDLLGKLHAGEMRIVLGILTEMFRESGVQGANDPLLNVLDEAMSATAAYPETVGEMTRLCVQHLLVDPLRLGPVLQGFLLRLAEKAAEPVLARLWEEVSTVSDPAPRAILLGVLIETERDESRTPELCDIVVEELLREDQEELARQKLGHGVAALGMVAARALLKRFETASGRQQTTLVPFVDNICMAEGFPAKEREQVAAQLLAALKLADRRLRMEILRSRVFQQPGLPARAREAVARELIPMLRFSEEHPEMMEQAAVLLESLGEAAAPALFEMIQARPAKPEADLGARVLGRTLARGRGKSRLVPSVMGFVRRRVAQPGNRLGGYAVALGELGASGRVSAKEAQEAFELLAGRVLRVSYQADAVEALGALAVCKAISARQRIRAVHLLGSMVDRPADEEETTLSPVETDAGPVYEFAGRLEFDSDTLPAAVRALGNIALAEVTSVALRGRIVDQLLRVWEGVAAWTTIWGPRGAQALALALGGIGADERTDDALRARTIKALALALERITAVRALDAVFGGRSASAEVNRLCVETALKMLDRWIEPEIMPEELQTVLSVAARAAARPEVSSRSSLARRLRQQTTELLFNSLKAGRYWVREPLSRMRDCPAVPKRLRAEIGDRLDKAFALVRTRE